MLFGMVAFVIVTFFVTQETKYFAIPGTEDPFIIVAPVALVAGMGIGNFLFQKLITPAQDENKTLRQKISIYFSSTIIRYALIEAPVLIATVAFNLSSNTFYLIFIGVGILYFFTLKPRPDKVAKDLNLTYDQRDELGIKE